MRGPAALVAFAAVVPSAVWAVVLSSAASLATAAPPQAVQQRLAPLDADWRAELDRSIKRCRDLNRDDLAQRTNVLRLSRDGKATRLFLANDIQRVRTAVWPGADADDVERYWAGHLKRLREKRAEHLLDVAEQVCDSHPSESYRLCMEALCLSSDDATLRTILGYKRDAEGVWVRQANSTSTVQQRPNAALGLDAHWRIRTPHFEILSEAGRSAGETLAAEIEALYDAWTQLFVPMWIDASTLKRRLKGAAAIPPLRRHRVILFRSRERYLESLQKKEPRIGVSVGLYRPQDKTSYFYWDPKRPPRTTWLHEVTHQLFSEIRRAAPNAGLRRNFWLIEGIAMYMESLRKSEKGWLIGGPGVERLQYARLRMAPAGDVSPFVRLGRGEMQRSESLSMLYSDACGLACFLMDAEQQKYRAACNALLLQVYQGRDEDGSVFHQTKLSPAKFAEQYHAFLQDFGDADMPQIGAVKKLCLRNSKVTPAGLRQLRAEKIEWLDAAGMPYDGKSLAATLADAKQLSQLNVEGSLVGDDLLAEYETTWRQRWPQLIELDLSQTKVGDASMRQLANANLEVLWLTKTQVSAAGLSTLASMKRLKFVNLAGLGLDDNEQTEIQTALPNAQIDFE